MIKSLDRITYLASSLEKAEKTFSSFFDLKPSKRVISAEKNYESLIYIFENMCFEVIEKKDDLSEKNKLYGFSLLSNDLSSIDISITNEKNDRNEQFEDKVQSIKSIDIKQSPDFQLLVNEYDDLNINLFKLTADGTSDALDTPITVDLLGSSYVTDIEGISLTGASPDFTKEQFLAHSQARINEAMNNYAVKRSDDTLDKATILGVSTQLFGRTTGSAGNILNQTYYWCR